jgi:hypothetical protein
VTRRLLQLYAGLLLYGFTLALNVEAGLGLDPWDVLHQGLSYHMPLTIGVVTIVVGALVLLAWIPLRQKPGLGTISNVIVIGLAMDAGIWLLPAPDLMWQRVTFMLLGVGLNGVATAAYIGARFGPGPRDGLMTGLVARTGRSVRLIRTSIELFVLAIGWLLGGTVGVGTVLYAVTIGPIIHVLLPVFTVPESVVESEPVHS